MLEIRKKLKAKEVQKAKETAVEGSLDESNIDQEEVDTTADKPVEKPKEIIQKRKREGLVQEIIISVSIFYDHENSHDKKNFYLLTLTEFLSFHTILFLFLKYELLISNKITDSN